MEKARILLTPKKEQGQRIVIISGLIFVFVFSVAMIDLDGASFVQRLERIPRVLRNFMAVDLTVLSDGFSQLLISIAMALAGIALGAVIAVVLAFLAAYNTTPFKPLSPLIKGVVAVIRAIPSIVLILMIMAALGLGPLAAVASLTLSSIGYFTKAFASTIEEQSKDLMETMRATGASWLQIIIHGFLPNVLPSFLAWFSMRLEMSISESIALGVIGAGGIGTMLNRALRQSQHAQVTTLLLLIFGTMLLIELLLNKIKKKA